MSKAGRTLRVRVAAGALIALVVAGLAVSRAWLRPAPVGAFMAVPGCDQNPAALNEIGSSVARALTARPTQDDQRVERIHSICAQGNSAYVFVQSYSPRTGQALSSPADVVLARLTRAGWRVTLTRSAAEYDQALADMPESLLPQTAKELLRQPQAATAARFSGFSLPFPAGESAYVIRHWYPAIDFSIGVDGGTGTIRNAKAGTAVFVKDSSTRKCGNPPPDWVCWMWANAIVIQSGPNEFAWYLHLAPDTVPDWLQEGVFVPAGADIAQEGATGWAAGPHLHFQVASTYSCCAGQGDYRMPNWPFSTMQPVDFNEYGWWDLPWQATSQNGAAAAQAPPADQAAAAPPDAGNSPPVGPVGGGGAPAGSGVTPACGSSYIVQPGDYLIRIAEKCGVKLADIIPLNPGIRPSLIYAGQSIALPGAPAVAAMSPAEPAPEAASAPGPEVASAPAPEVASAPEPVVASAPEPPASACSGTHTVVRGDTLWRIATDCGLTVAQMAELNGLYSPFVIYAGQELKYP